MIKFLQKLVQTNKQKKKKKKKKWHARIVQQEKLNVLGRIFAQKTTKHTIHDDAKWSWLIFVVWHYGSNCCCWRKQTWRAYSNSVESNQAKNKLWNFVGILNGKPFRTQFTYKLTATSSTATASIRKQPNRRNLDVCCSSRTNDVRFDDNKQRHSPWARPIPEIDTTNSKWMTLKWEFGSPNARFVLEGRRRPGENHLRGSFNLLMEHLRWNNQCWWMPSVSADDIVILADWDFRKIQEEWVGQIYAIGIFVIGFGSNRMSQVGFDESHNGSSARFLLWSVTLRVVKAILRSIIDAFDIRHRMRRCFHILVWKPTEPKRYSCGMRELFRNVVCLLSFFF